MKMIQKVFFRVCFQPITTLNCCTTCISWEIGSYNTQQSAIMNIRTFVAILSRNPQHDFPKMRGGGSKAVWNFSEVSSVLVCPSVPKTPLEIFLAYLLVGLDYWNSPSHGTLIAWSPNSIRWVHRCQDFALSTIDFMIFFFIKVSFMKHPNVRAFEDIIDNVIMICINGLSLKKFLNFILIS